MLPRSQRATSRSGSHRAPAATFNQRSRATGIVAIGAIVAATGSGAPLASAAPGDAPTDTISAASAAPATATAAPAGATAAATPASKAPAAATNPAAPAVPAFAPQARIAEQILKATQANVKRLETDRAARGQSPVMTREAYQYDGVRSIIKQFAQPAIGSFTSGFGPRWGSFHYGVDIANAEGTPIYAVMDGTVIDAGPASGYGNWVRIKHDDGSVSVYGHMMSLLVSVGQRVAAGEHIAAMGNLGFSTGSHLHFEIHPDGITPVDPASWLASHGIYI